jgi:hypothetical protein
MCGLGRDRLGEGKQGEREQRCDVDRWRSLPRGNYAWGPSSAVKWVGEEAVESQQLGGSPSMSLLWKRAVAKACRTGIYHHSFLLVGLNVVHERCSVCLCCCWAGRAEATVTWTILGKFPQLIFCVRILQVNFPHASDCHSNPLPRFDVPQLRSLFLVFQGVISFHQWPCRCLLYR